MRRVTPEFTPRSKHPTDSCFGVVVFELGVAGFASLSLIGALELTLTNTILLDFVVK